MSDVEVKVLGDFRVLDRGVVDREISLCGKIAPARAKRGMDGETTST